MKANRAIIISSAALILCVCLVSCAGRQINEDEAKNIAFEHFGLKAEDCTAVRLEYDDGNYEIEFISGGKEYDAEVDATSGRVREVDVDIDDNVNTSTNTTALTPAESTDTEASQELTEAEAVDIALSHFGVLRESCDYIRAVYDRGEWDVEFVFDGKEYDAEVDAATGRVRETDVDVDDDNRGHSVQTNVPEAEIGADEAKRLAAEHFGLQVENCTFVKAERDGRKYEIEFYSGNTEYEAEVDAFSGEIIETDIDR
ncbi:MAG: PepSY domain-containing protein [Clostridia bacterium]|nr:PepSY domain-containing protein [Clostridia bacterium]